MEVGVCALCLKEAELCRSHLIPKGFYRSVIDNEGDVIQVSGGKATIPPGMGQMTARLLCKQCENHFSRVEKIIISEGCRNSNFPLLEKINNAKYKHPFGDSTSDFMVFPSEVPDIDWNSYLFFALSVFWRCSVVRNIKEISSYYNAFGKYQDEIRNMLLAKLLSLPNHMYFCIQVNNDITIPLNLLGSPSVISCSGYHVHHFTVPNMVFHLMVGKRINNTIMGLRQKYGPCSICVGKVVDYKYGKNLCKMVQSAIPYGRAKDFS